MSAGIRIRSGSVPSEKIAEVVQGAKDRAVLLGVSATIAQLLPSVAFKTGQLAREVKSSYDDQVTTQAGADIITIKFERDIIIANVIGPPPNNIPYAEFHINPGGSFISYQNPTSPGTKPINEFEWNEAVADNIEAILPFEMVKEGLVVSERF